MLRTGVVSACLAIVALLDQDAPVPAPAPATSPAPVVGLCAEPPLVELPRMVSGGQVRVDLRLVNRGATELVLEAIEVANSRFVVERADGTRSEGSNRVAFDPPVRMAAGDALPLVLESSTQRRGVAYVGAVSKVVSARVAGAKEPVKLAEVRVTLVPGYAFTPPSLKFGTVKRGADSAIELALDSNELGPFRILGIELSHPAPLELGWSPASDAPAAKSHRIAARVSADAALGQHFGHLRVAIDHPLVRSLRVPFGLTVLPRFDARFGEKNLSSGDSVSFGVLRVGAASLPRIVVRNSDPQLPWAPEAATLSTALPENAAAFAIETAAGATPDERVITIRLVAPPKSRLVRGELRMPLHHADLAEFVLTWSAIVPGGS